MRGYVFEGSSEKKVCGGVVVFFLRIGRRFVKLFYLSAHIFISLCLVPLEASGYVSTIRTAVSGEQSAQTRCKTKTQ